MLLLAALSPAHACLIAVGSPHEVVADPEDEVPPTDPGAPALQITRGEGPTCVGGICVSDSCDDLGAIAVSFSAAEDDVSAPEAIGYRMRVVEGAPPGAIEVDETRRADSLSSDGTAHLAIIWNDSAGGEQEAFAFTLGLTAVDEAGNESDEITVEIADEGSGGCSTLGGGLGATAVLLGALSVGARRRSA